MLCDFHLHTGLSYDSQASVEDVINTAINKGMTHIAITDHHDFDIEFGVFEQDAFLYYNTIKSYSNHFKDHISVAVGIELGITPTDCNKLDEFIKKRPFDFVIGSVHGVCGIDPYYEKYWDGLSTYEGMMKYFNYIYESICSFDNFDVLGHIDYAIRYTKNDEDKAYSYETYKDILDKILKTIILMNKGIEINTGGLRKGLSTTNPSEAIIKRYYELGGRIITVGSDAHDTKDIGADFNQAKEILKRCGFSQYCIFKKRKPVFLDI